MAVLTSDRLSQAFATALEHRSGEIADVVSDSNVITYVLKKNGAMKTYSGPTIRKTIRYAKPGNAAWYSGYDYLEVKPSDTVRDVEYVPKLLSGAAVISGEQWLANMGKTQLIDLFDEKIKGVKLELQDEFARALHSNGTGNAGKEIVGLQAAIPTDPTSGTYAGVNRANATWWQTKEYDIDTDFTVGSQFTSSTAYQIYEQVAIATSRGKQGSTLILASQNHYTAFSAALTAIQRVTQSGKATLGFPSLQFAGAGRTMDVVLEGGIGTNMPANVSYFLDTNGMEVCYHPSRNFTPYNGKQTPVNQDAIVQHIGFMGELVITNPLHQAKLHDSDTAS